MGRPLDDDGRIKFTRLEPNASATVRDSDRRADAAERDRLRQRLGLVDLEALDRTVAEHIEILDVRAARRVNDRVVLGMPRFQAALVFKQLQHEAYGEHAGGEAVRAFLRQLGDLLEEKR